LTARQRVLAAISLSGSVMLALVLLAYFARTQLIPAAILLLLMPLVTLRLTRHLQGLPAHRFHFRGLLFGLMASLGFMGVAFPLGPSFAVLGMVRDSVVWQVLVLVTYFVIGAIGAAAGAWIAANIKITHTPSSGV
jgi:hypothetical protein